MKDNLNVCLEIRKNNFEELEVNDFNRRALLNNNFLGLSFYELACRPREIFDTDKIEIDDKKIERIIKELLRCNICLQIYEEPVNIRSCLHKFCKKCIEDYNRRIKKECALCRHPIETRRLLREDIKIRDIIKCLIPNIKKFNDVEENYIKANLTSLCFKDTDRKKQQDVFTDSVYETDEARTSSEAYINNLNNNLNNINNPTSGDNELLKRKQKRKETKSGIGNKRGSNKKLAKPAENDFKNGVISVGIKLICDADNEEMKKYFSKTKLYTNDDISLDYFSKYICFKHNHGNLLKENIIFFVSDENKNKLELDKNLNLKEIKKKYKIADGDLIKLYFNLSG